MSETTNNLPTGDAPAPSLADMLAHMQDLMALGRMVGPHTIRALAGVADHVGYAQSGSQFVAVNEVGALLKQWPPEADTLVVSPAVFESLKRATD